MNNINKFYTNKDALNSYLTSTLTIGLTQYIDNKFNNIISNGNLNNNPFATTGQQFTSALAESTISNITSTAVQSAFNGDNFGESLKNQLLTSLVMAGAKIGANEIGSLAHETEVIDNNGNIIGYIPAEINRMEQLLLHAGLGAITAKLTNNDMLSGAVAGVVGEVAGSYAKENGIVKNDGIKIAGFASTISSMFTGLVQGQEGQTLTDNIYNAQRIGENAAENNSFAVTATISLTACASNPVCIQKIIEGGMMLTAAIASQPIIKTTIENYLDKKEKNIETIPLNEENNQNIETIPLNKDNNSSNIESLPLNDNNIIDNDEGIDITESSAKDNLEGIDTVDNKEKGGNILVSQNLEEKEEFKNFDKHYEKHSKEFGNISKNDYLQKANSLKEAKVGNSIVEYKRINGDLIKYDKINNEFISIDPQGNIRTFFKPSGGIEYWQNQIGDL